MFLKKYRTMIFVSLIVLLVIAASARSAEAQTTAFTYQGKLTENAAAANGRYDMQFRLFDNPNAGQGTQQGASITNSNISVNNGIFSVQLDFGGAVFAVNAQYFLEISLRPAGSMGGYTSLAPRQTISSVPYAVKSINADSANNASQLGGMGAAQFVQTTDSRLNSILNQNSAPQNANFNISGDASVGGVLTGNSINSGSNFTIQGYRALGYSGASGTTLTVGFYAGEGGANNSFFGQYAGHGNFNGTDNSYFGYGAGDLNDNGKFNSFFGSFSGAVNKADSNSFFGESTGRSTTTGGSNSFFGARSGRANTTGGFNSFFGIASGFSNTTGNFNSFFGQSSGYNTTTGGSNSFFGSFSGLSNIDGAGNAFFGASAGKTNDGGSNNAFFGSSAGLNNTSGNSNVFIGSATGLANTTGTNNTIIGFGANLGAANLTNATAIGTNAVVSQSNSIVLGLNANVGIGTSAPKSKLEIASGDIYLSNAANGVILKSPNGQCWRVTIGNTGALTSTSIACP